MTTAMRGILSLVLATFLYGFFGILSRIVQLNIPLFYQNWTRALVASAIAYLFLAVSRQQKPLRKKDIVWIIARTLAGNIAFIAFFFAIIHLPIGTAYFIFYGASTIIGYLLGYLLFKERLTLVKVIALFLALAGLALVYSINVLLLAPFYLALALISGAMTAMWNIFSKKISHHYSAFQLTFLDNFYSLGIYLTLSLLTREAWSLPTISAAWVASVTLGVFFVATGLLVVYGFKHLDAQIGSLVMLVEIIFAIFFGFLFYQETVGVLTLLGGALIITAIVLPELPARKS